MSDDQHLGTRIRALRIAAGLRQYQLSDRAKISLSLLEKVERGDRATTPHLIAAVARALKVPPERITGQPYDDHKGDRATHQAVEELRTVLRHYDLPDDIPPRPLDDLAADVDAVAQLRRDADYKKLGARLPALLQELTSAAHTLPSSHTATVYGLLVTVYQTAHTLLHRCGYPDLAESVEHLLERAAHRASDPLAFGLAQWTRAQAFQSAGDYGPALRLMDTARADLADELRTPTPQALTIVGSLHLRSVTLASRAGDADATRHHLAEAHRLAQSRKADAVHYGLTFGDANRVIHEVAAHVELGDSAAALAAAADWTPPGELPRTRRGHFYIDLARAYLLHGDQLGALNALQTAKEVAPQQTRLHPMVRDTTALLVTQHRRGHPELTTYAQWVGIAPAR